ncbi:hypothetical protein FX984_06372 [Pseudomonas marginalis]|nr:hypothetical protein FX984_06372 [Pseudomonas marginalis]
MVTCHGNQRRRLGTLTRFEREQRGDKSLQARLFEQHLERHFQCQRLAQSRGHLHGQQRVPAQLEEVIHEADALHPEDIRPHRRHLHLKCTDRRDPGLQRKARIRFWQCLAIQLAVGVQRQALKEHQVGRHHIVRQLLTQYRLERFFQCAGVWLFGHQIGQQLVVHRQHHGLTNTRLGQQQGFDFTQLDTETADLDLMIDPPYVFDHAIGTVTRQIPGTVQAIAVTAERISDKAFGRQQWPVQVSARQTTGAADIQLAHGAQRREVEVPVQHVQSTPRQGATNRAGGGANDVIARGAVQHTGDHRGLGRSIGVEQSHMPQARTQPLCGTVQRHGFATDMHLPQGTIGTRSGCQTVEQEHVPVGRRQVGQGNALLQDFAVQAPAVPQFRATQYHGCAVGERRIQLLDEPIEVQGRKLQYAVILSQLGITGGNAREFAQGAMVDRHALGFTGRAGGIDHIGQVVRPDCCAKVFLGVRRQRDRIDRQDSNACGQRHRHTGLDQHQAHATVFEYMSQAFARVLRVERHIGTTGLKDRQQADHHGKGALYCDPHQHFRTHALCHQAMSQTVGLPIERVIGQ